MQRLSRGPKLPLLRARSFRFDRRRRSLSVSATRPVRHSAPLRLSMIARSHEVDLVDTWRADSQSLSVARLARNYPMCQNALPQRSGTRRGCDASCFFRLLTMTREDFLTAVVAPIGNGFEFVDAENFLRRASDVRELRPI